MQFLMLIILKLLYIMFCPYKFLTNMICLKLLLKSVRKFTLKHVCIWVLILALQLVMIKECF